MGYDTFELRVRERTLDGRQFGRVTVTVAALVDEGGTPLNEIRDTDGNIILSGSATVTATGASTNDVTVFLPDPHDVTLVPTGFGYQVQVVADSVTKPSVIFGPDEITAFGVGGVLYLEDITPVGGVTFTGTGSYATTADLAGEAALRVSGDASALQKTAHLSDLANAGTARTNLGLGNAATKAVGTTTGTVAAGDDSRFTAGGGVSIDTVTIYAGDHGTLDPTGAADNAGILRSCYTAALASLASGAKATRIIWPAGNFKMASVGAFGIATAALPVFSTTEGHTGRVSVEGQGVDGTVFKMSNTAPCLVTTKTTGLDGVFGNMTLRGFTVDQNAVTGVHRQGAVLSLRGNVDFAGVLVEDVNCINMGTPGTSKTMGIQIESNPGVWNSSTAHSIRDITIRRCHFGAINGVGKGGNYGVLIQAFDSQRGDAPQHDSDIIAGGFNSNVYLNDILIEDVHWDSGISVFQGTPDGDSAGVMIGSGGVLGRVRLTDCSVKGSLDVGYEVSSAYDVIFTRCYSEDALNTHFYYRPQGGMPNIDAPTGASTVNRERSMISFIDCTARNKKLASSTQGMTPTSALANTVGFYAHAKDFGMTGGHVVFRNCHYVLDGPNAIFGTGQLNRIGGGFRTIDIDGLRTSVSGYNWGTTWPISPSVGGLGITARNGRGVLRVRGLTLSVAGTNGSTGKTLGVTTLALSILSDYLIDIDDVHSRVNAITTGAGGTTSLNEIAMGLPNEFDNDQFNSTIEFTQGWRSDLTASGQSTADLSSTSNTLSFISPSTTEYRLSQMRNESAGDYHAGMIGPLTDQNTALRCTKPTAPTAAYKQGVRLKVDPETGGNSIHCYVAFDGANYNLNIDTEVGGALTNRATTSLGASIASPFWVRGKIIGNAVTAEYLTAATTSATAPTATTTATYTVNANDGTLALFGGAAPQGYPGMVWTPVDSGSTVKTFTSYFQNVISGRIARVGTLSASGTASARGLTSPHSAPSQIFRFRRPLELPDWDLSGYEVVGVLSNGQSITDTTFKQNIRASRWQHLTPPADAAITPGASPYTYTNQDGYDEDVAIYGGTVSAISVTRVGGSSSQVSDSTGRVLRLSPGEAVTVTYSVVPTMRKTPVP